MKTNRDVGHKKPGAVLQLGVRMAFVKWSCLGRAGVAAASHGAGRALRKR